MDENEVIINDQFGEIPYYDEGYGVFPRNKYVNEYIDFETDQEIYDADSHKATSFSLASAIDNPEVGSVVQLDINVTPNVANVPVCVWETSNPAVAQVNGQGQVFFYGPGRVTITAINVDDPTITASLSISVVSPGEETKVIVTINVAEDDTEVTILKNTDNVEGIEIDGELLSEVTTTYTFAAGEHTIKYNLIDDTAIDDMISTVSCVTVSLPESVVSIGNQAFSGCTSLTSITIPNSVTFIGDYAFNGCSNLTSVNIPEGVTEISNAAFQGCSSLTSVNIPSSVTSIDQIAFNGCSGLTSIVVEDGNTVYDSRNNCNAVIETSTNKLIVGCETTVIPESVTFISSYSLSNRGLTSVIIPDNVITIDGYAFNSNSDLTEVDFGTGVAAINYSAFGECTSLATLMLRGTTPPVLTPPTFSQIFNNCPVTKIYVPADSVDTYKAASGWSDAEALIEAIPEPVETRVIVTYEIDSADLNTPYKIFDSGAADIDEIEIDGAVQENISTEYTFTEAGTHIIKYSFKDETSISDNFLSDVLNIRTIKVPNSVTTVSEGAFYVSTSSHFTTDFYFYSTVPPTIDGHTFNNNAVNKIYVPADSVDTYKTTGNWIEWSSYIEAIPAEEPGE